LVARSKPFYGALRLTVPNQRPGGYLPCGRVAL